MEDLSLTIIPITAGLVEGLKRNFDLDGKYYFLASIINGLASSGLYSGLKSTLEQSNQDTAI